ncbi:MAG: barstar family protein [Patescibacteria group bacterium]
MKTYVLDSAKFTGIPEFYDEVSRTFGFFDEFGRNLDALADCLDDASGLSEIRTPCSVVWKSSPNDALDPGFREGVFEIFREVDGIDFRVE